ncbi:hypothetical protein N7528_005506 [Penicillium herquei]|nr:hypothetical protein N7528_005506 [Penicillium herquei]
MKGARSSRDERKSSDLERGGKKKRTNRGGESLLVSQNYHAKTPYIKLERFFDAGKLAIVPDIGQSHGATTFEKCWFDC